jgi:hypothetical protein
VLIRAPHKLTIPASTPSVGLSALCVLYGSSLSPSSYGKDQDPSNPKLIILSRDLVTVDGVWIGNRIYRTLTERN